MTDQTTTGFVPAGTRVFLRRRFEEVGGFLLLLLAIAYLVALLTASRSLVGVGAAPSRDS